MRSVILLINEYDDDDDIIGLKQTQYSSSEKHQQHLAKDGRGMSSLDGEESGTDEAFGIGFLSVPGDEDDAVRLVGLAAGGFGEDVAFLSELCPDLHQIIYCFIIK